MIIKNRLGEPLLELERTGDDLEGLALEDANLPEADLRGADLYEAYLPGANLKGADLRAANLRGATLREAECRPPRTEYLPLTILGRKINLTTT